MNDENLKRYKVTLIVITLIAVAFGSGYYFGNVERPKSADIKVSGVLNSSSTINLDQFWTVWKILDEKFVYTKDNAEKISDQDKLYGAIQGLVASYGDPHTIFFPPEESKNFESDISGSFEGVGMELSTKGSSIVVISPLKDTPAYKAGVKKGDIISTIDGKSTANMSVDDAVKLIRGKAGTDVVIKVARSGESDLLDVKITRGVIDIPTTETEIKSDVFVIHLYNFYATSPEKFRLALREFAESGKTKLVLDLRGNPGGYLEAAVDMASWFLPMGKTVVRENFGNNAEEQVYRSKGYNVFNDKLNMVILADEGSASASEILAGALREHGVAKIVGTRTFGKGSVQELVKIPPDASLKVTIARWLTPNGVSISDNGLTPDYEVKYTEADSKADRDPQMEKALELLK